MKIILTHNVDELVRGFHDLKPQMQKGILASLRKSVRVVRGKAVLLSPVDLGNLRASIYDYVDVMGPEGYVGSNVEYAAYQEYGTKFMDAQPYLRPALDESVGAIQTIFNYEIQDAIDKHRWGF
jgi:HK97 gp10 family phage protein